MTNKEKIAAYLNKIKSMVFTIDSNLEEMEKLQSLVKSLEQDTINYNDFAFMSMCPIDGLCGFQCDGRCKINHEFKIFEGLLLSKKSCWENALSDDIETTEEFKNLSNIIKSYEFKPDFILVNKDYYKKLAVDGKVPTSFIEKIPVVMTNLEFEYGFTLVVEV